MPRPPTHRHVLRDLRNVIKCTQLQFAKLLGVSRVYINKIENGQIAVSPSLAIRVHVLTGISVDELAKGPDGKLIDLIGKPYSAETFVWWQKKMRQPSGRDIVRCVRNLRWWTWILLRAAADHHKGTAYNAVVAALFQSLSPIRRDFGLQETTDRLLREYAPPVKWLPGGRTPRELRAIDRELQQALKDAEEIQRRGATFTWHLPQQSKQSSSRRRRKA